jgi:6-pyruvoyltetrahydropterin/6-carboxytetrahydropterin synthase
MYQVTREISFCYGHRLLNYDGKCRNLHGHNGKAVITIESECLDKLGMVMDFGDIKKAISTWIDETLDHRMLLHKDDPLVPILVQMNEPICVMETNPTAETIAKYIFDFVQAKGFPVAEVILWETDSCFARFASVKSSVAVKAPALSGLSQATASSSV